MPAAKSVSRRRPAVDPADFDDGFAGLSHAIAHLLGKTPDAIIGLIEILLQADDEHQAPRRKSKGAGKNANRKRMSEADLFAHGLLLSQALQELRYDVERNRKEAIAQTEYLRQYLLEAGQRPGINPNMFLFVLQRFAAAKVDAGDELRALAEQVLANLAGSLPKDERPRFRK
jgi:hypothetical protein